MKTADVIGIIDPGAPSWLIDTLGEALPEMFSVYTTEFGEPLP